jgi:thioredoxin reductase (NADPH)
VAEVEQNVKIDFVLNSKITEFIGEERLSGVKLENTVSGISEEREIDGVFIFIGYTPNTEFLEGKIALNTWGEIKVSEELQTNIPGVYAAGDCIPKKIRQVTTAVSDGTIAALSAADYIHQKKKDLVVI